MNKIKLSELKKFVINLDRRKDRLEHFKNEMSWIGWDFERFDGIDTNSYIGCALSHKKLAEICLDLDGDYFMFLEDDIFFMPYSKEQIEKCENELNNIDFDFFHLAPSLHRPVNNLTKNLLDITNLPNKDENKHREVFGTSGFILNKKTCEYILNWDTNKYIENSHRQLPIDEFLAKGVYPNIKAVASSLPIITQINDFSDINNGFYNNHFTMTYNWNHYTENKLEGNLLDLDYCKTKRNEN
jgi:GR25 family glycosyltransferase involved in LPS biosynthesis